MPGYVVVGLIAD